MKSSRKLTPMLDREYAADADYFAELGLRIHSHNSQAVADWLN